MTPLFLIQSHRNPPQLARLVRVIRQGCPNSIVLISHDFRATLLSRATFGDDQNVHLIDGKGGRGDFEIVDGYLAALRWLRDNKIAYDWLTNLSGQDYPVSSLAAFARELIAAKHDGFLHHFDSLIQDPGEMGPMRWPPRHGHDRYLFHYTRLKDALTGTERALLRYPRLALDRFSANYRINTAYGLMIGRRARHNPFTPQFRCYAGSYWHTIRRRCADYLLNFAETKPDVVAYLRRVLIPDECFVQTALANNHRFRFVNDNRRYYDMRGSRRGHPKVLSEEDMTEFLGGRYVFARKFEPADGSDLLDRLDHHALSDRNQTFTRRAVIAAQAG
jgi:hypothetical protein